MGLNVIINNRYCITISGAEALGLRLGRYNRRSDILHISIVLSIHPCAF